MHQTLQFNKFEGVDFKYGNGFFEFQPKNIEIKHFFAVNVSFFKFLHETSYIEKFEGTNFKNGNSLYPISAKNTQIRDSLWKFKNFFFLRATLSELSD